MLGSGGVRLPFVAGAGSVLLVALALGTGGVVADEVGLRLGAELASATAGWLEPFARDDGSKLGVDPASVLTAESEGDDAEAPRSLVGGAGAGQRHDASQRPPARPRGLRVRASTVLALASAGVRPSGSFVPAESSRPAGLVLSGVSGLGVGLVDGDVLTHAAGQPVRSSGQVVGLVLGARAHGAAEIGGTFWRRGERWQLVVEQPYPTRRAAEGAPAGERVAREFSAPLRRAL